MTTEPIKLVFYVWSKRDVIEGMENYKRAFPFSITRDFDMAYIKRFCDDIERTIEANGETVFHTHIDRSPRKQNGGSTDDH